MADELTLKWGSIKGWEIETEEFRNAIKKWFDSGNVSMSAMMQKDTPEQVSAILEAIDSCNGDIWNDWEGTKMTKEDAKKYILEYGK